MRREKQPQWWACVPVCERMCMHVCLLNACMSMNAKYTREGVAAKGGGGWRRTGLGVACRGSECQTECWKGAVPVQCVEVQCMDAAYGSTGAVYGSTVYRWWQDGVGGVVGFGILV